MKTRKNKNIDYGDYYNYDDKELVAKYKEFKKFSVLNALLIGFLIGIIFYSLVKSSWGFFTLIPLYIIYRLVNDPRNKKLKEIEQIIKERNL